MSQPLNKCYIPKNSRIQFGLSQLLKMCHFAREYGHQQGFIKNHCIIFRSNPQTTQLKILGNFKRFLMRNDMFLKYETN